MDSSNKTPGYFKGILLILCGVVVLSVLAALIPSLVRNSTGLFPSSGGDFGVSEDNPDAAASAQYGITNPDREVRGVWIASVANINYPSEKGLSADKLRAELDDIVNTMVENGLNTVYFQVRPTSDALYKSDIYPVSDFLTGTAGGELPDGFDPLGYLIEAAHKNDIAVHAWINPLRITAGSSSSPQHDTSVLAENSPARLHSEWTVNYDDGRMYFDCGIPEVRQLVADGVAEIVRGYAVDGIVFDDYFYPYPVSGSTFNDDATYAAYGEGFSKEDWRRSNVNTLVKLCYDTVKSIDENCLFGVSPFGIWQNDDGSNGGSDTSGLESYSALFCDTLAWIKGGYVDYIAPQLYWQFSTSSARYDVLLKWWNARLSEYPEVALLVGHGAYRSAEWGNDYEIKTQIEYARSEKAYRGSILYGYAALKANDGNIQKQLAEVYEDEIIYSDIKSSGSGITVNSPADGSELTVDSTYLIGICDPAYPLYFAGKAVSVTKSGYFSVYTSLSEGENSLEFTQNGTTYVHKITRSSPSGETEQYELLDGYTAELVSPAGDWIGRAGDTIELKVYAPAKSTVTAMFNGSSVTLIPTVNPASSEKYVKETYTGKLTAPSAPEGEIYDAGRIKITAVAAGDQAETESGKITVLGDGASYPVVMKEDDGNLKISSGSWYYDDYAPQALGMCDEAEGLLNGYYKLRMGGYVPESQAEYTAGAGYASASVSKADITSDDKYTYINFYINANVPMHSYVSEGKFYVSLYNCTSEIPEISVPENNMLFSSCSRKDAGDGTVTYELALIDSDNFYGFDFKYLDGCAVVMLRNPQKLSEGELPLSGRRIWLDAGHGGDDTGALGADPDRPESYFNLEIVLLCAKKLESLGAEVMLTRSDDTAVNLSAERMKLLNDADPDIAISVHQNSMEYNVDITGVRGLIALYYADSGKLLANTVSGEMASALNRYERTAARQRLAMVRNPKFPSMLVETGFMTNVEETEKMVYGGGIEKAADGIAAGILAYYTAQQQYIK